jgi:hypothetical protein
VRDIEKFQEASKRFRWKPGQSGNPGRPTGVPNRRQMTAMLRRLYYNKQQFVVAVGDRTWRLNGFCGAMRGPGTNIDEA